MSLGKQEPPYPGPACRNFETDALIEADPARHVLNVGPGPLAKIGDLVDERYLGCEKSVGRILRELGGAAACDQERRLIEVERPVDFPHDGFGTVVLDANDNTVWPFEIADCRPFAEEFGVGNNGKIGVQPSSRMILSTSSPVPTGTVDFVTITVNPARAAAIVRAAW